MRAIRNLIYNTSDILVALIILAVAVLLIWSRIDVIMGYPSTQDEQKTTSIQAEADLPSEEGDVLAEGEGRTEEPAVSTSDVPADPENYLKVTIPNGASNDVVAGLLKQAGVITETNDFITAIEGSELNGAVIPGDHWIPKGSNMGAVIQALTVTGVPGQ